MQQFVYNSFYARPQTIDTILHLNRAAKENISTESHMTALQSDQEQSSSEDFNINFGKDTSQDFGLEYWINHTIKQQSPSASSHKPHKSVFNNKLKQCNTNECSLSLSYHKPRRSKKNKTPVNNNYTDLSHQKSNNLKYFNCDIPKLKLSKNVIKNYIKTLSPRNLSQSSSSESEFSLYLSHNEKKKKRSKFKIKRQHGVSESKSCTSSVISNSNCLEKSFEKSNDSIAISKCPLSMVNNDIMHLTLIVDRNEYRKSIGSINTHVSLDKDSFLRVNDKLLNPQISDQISTCNVNNLAIQVVQDQYMSPLFSTELNCDSLSYSCDNPSENIKPKIEYYIEESKQRTSPCESSKQTTFSTPNISNRKRNISSLIDEENDTISTKKILVDSYLFPELVGKNDEDKCAQNMTPVDYVRLVMDREKSYESLIFNKYCLSQPNAMKFLAKNHADNWESHKNNLSQMHLVPCEFLNEIFHRALHCFGLEKKILKNTLSGNSSPINSCNSSHSTEYKKIRDEYSFSLKRVRYGIGVIDELFCRKVNYQNISQNDDVPIVRKWKHIIYYLCLHAKSTFMAKEVQYYNYIQFISNSFDTSIDLYANNTPSTRCSSTIVETYNKSQLPKSSKFLLDCKLIQRGTPEHFSQSDLEISPHSYDSGKGSSIRTSYNTNSLVSGCHTTSSLNSTPHSLHESLPNLSAFQMYRIDEYQMSAQEYIRLCPEVSQLHNKIISKVGIEPNANSHDNMIKLIHYVDIVLQMSKDDLMHECLQRLLSQAVRL